MQTLPARHSKHILFTAPTFLLALLLTACGGAAPGGGDLALGGKTDIIKGDGHQTPVCTVDRFKQPDAPPVAKKIDVLFVMDTSESMERHWQLIAAKIDSLTLQFPKGQDFRIAVILGNIEKNTGVLFSAPGQPKVLDGLKLNNAQIMASLKKTFSNALIYDNTDWIGAGEALFYSLHAAATTKASAIQKQGFFRPDASLNVVFMSDDAEESYPYPSKQIWNLPNKCNWAHHERMRKTYYVPRKIDADTTYTALRKLKGDMPLVTNAFVNITRADVMTGNKEDAHCIYDTAGFGYFDIVKRSGGVLWSIHRDRSLGLQAVGRMARVRNDIVHDFHLSKPSEKVDPASIRADVDGGTVDHTYRADTNVVHLENAGKAGSSVEIAHCEPVPQHEWSIQDFSGSAGQFQAQLVWRTPELATSGRVAYGTDPASLNDIASDPANSTSHSVSVANLSPNTVYYFQAISADEFGTEKKSEVISLRTRPAWAMSALTGTASRNTAVLLWNTEAYATNGYIAYGTSPAQLDQASEATGVVNNHNVTIGGLSADTVYYFQAVSADEFGLEQKSNVISLRTVKDWAVIGLTGTASRFSASLTWATPEYPTESELRYGLSPNALTGVVKDDNIAIPHAAGVTGLSAGTTYYFQAVARDNLGVVKQSGVISLTTVADWYLNAVTAASTESSFTVSFATPGYPTNGKVLWGTTPQLGNELDAGVNSNDHGASATGLAQDTVYYFQVVASDDLGQEKRSQVGSVRTKKVEIPLPVWTIAGPDGSATSDTVNVTWKTLAYPTKGSVRYGTSPGSLDKSIDETEAGTEHGIAVAGLQPDTLYYFQVVARDDRGQSQESSVIAVRTQVKEIPLPVWSISGFRGTAARETAELVWKTSEYATTGRVRYGTSPDALGGSVSAPVPGRDHSVTVSGLSSDTLYYFQVVALDDRGQEKLSEVISLRTQEDPLPSWEISGFTGTGAVHSISARWFTETYATKGKIRYGTSSGNLNQETAMESDSALVHSFSIDGLAANTTYFLQAVATDDRGQTKTSGIISVKTLTVAPTWQIVGFDGTTTQTQANLIWQTPGAATKAVIKVGLSANDFSFKTVNVPDYATSHITAVTGLNPSTTYFFQVTAEDVDGGVVVSNVISKTTKARGK